ncbi:hypothetical protein [Cohnella rhizosphaerae]|uniref:Uncharacterized protein n=1 Tax=Cohnella rhizosphaerae TaxID=1457232 RepID=A0A9X4QSP3_9BACL|nr:hypothetical protein [Cohnella rhizosphaerae]MDG0808782.1 hypothetical protein [Cohnella rhizosphaerae]
MIHDGVGIDAPTLERPQDNRLDNESVIELVNTDRRLRQPFGTGPVHTGLNHRSI